jgi:hypothetical protein
MTMPSDITVIETGAPAGDAGSNVDWAEIIAGIVLPMGISLVLLTFGSAIGLSFANFRAAPDVAPIWIAIAAASWLLWVLVSSFMAGGYLTGRLRRRMMDATEHESDVRDGAHGLLVWGGSLVIGAFIAASGVGGLLNAAGSAASTLTNAASNVAGGAAAAAGDVLDPNAYFIDTLFRTAPASDETAAPAADTSTTPAASTEAPAASTSTPAASTTDTSTTPAASTDATTTAQSSTTTTAAAPASTTSSAPAVSSSSESAAAPADTTAVRDEVGRIFMQAGDQPVSDTDRAYLAQVVAQNTGLPPEQAQARVDEVMTAMDQAKQKAAEAAETARRTSVVAAFITAASLLVAAAGAFWAAQMGGNHRDKQVVFPGFARRV